MTRTLPLSASVTDAVLEVAAARKDAVLFAIALATDPDNRAFDHFLRNAVEVEDGDLDATWLASLCAAARKVGRGQINPADPWPVTQAVIAVRTQKSARRAWHRQNPVKPGPAGAAKRKWMRVDVDVANCPGPRLESEAEEGRWVANLDALNRAMDEAVDPVGLDIFRRVAEYTDAHGTAHGALTPIAAAARIVDGKLVLAEGKQLDSSSKPDPRVYRAVVRAYHAAKAEVVRILENQGLKVPPSLK